MKCLIIFPNDNDNNVNLFSGFLMLNFMCCAGHMKLPMKSRSEGLSDVWWDIFNLCAVFRFCNTRLTRDWVSFTST